MQINRPDIGDIKITIEHMFWVIGQMEDDEAKLRMHVRGKECV